MDLDPSWKATSSFYDSSSRHPSYHQQQQQQSHHGMHPPQQIHYSSSTAWPQEQQHKRASALPEHDVTTAPPVNKTYSSSCGDWSRPNISSSESSSWKWNHSCPRSVKSTSYTTSQNSRALTHSITRSDDQETESRLKRIMEEQGPVTDGAAAAAYDDMDDISAHSFDIPDPDQWEVRGFMEGEEDANSQCSVVAQDGDEEEYDWDPLNLLSSSLSSIQNVKLKLSPPEVKQEDEDCKMEEEEDANESQAVAASSVGDVVVMVSVEDGHHHHREKSKRSRRSENKLLEESNRNRREKKKEYEKSCMMPPLSSPVTTSFDPASSLEHHPKTTSMYSNDARSNAAYEGATSATTAFALEDSFLQHSGYRQDDPPQSQSSVSMRRRNSMPHGSTLAAPHLPMSHGHGHCHGHSHHQSHYEDDSTTRRDMHGHGWSHGTMSFEPTSSSESREMLQARLGLSSFRPNHRMEMPHESSSDYDAFARAHSFHAYAYSDENAHMKHRYGTTSVASAPADISSRNRLHHHGHGHGHDHALGHENMYMSMNHHQPNMSLPGYGDGHGHGNHGGRVSTMSVHSADYARSFGHGHDMPHHASTTLQHNSSGGGGGGGSGYYVSHQGSDVHSVASGHSMYSSSAMPPGQYPPPPSNNSYYSEHVHGSGHGQGHVHNTMTGDPSMMMMHMGPPPMCHHPPQNHNNMPTHQPRAPILPYHGAIISDMDRSLATKFSFAVLYEIESCSFESRDRTGKRRGLDIGFRGLACRHCQGFTRKIGGRLFPSTIKTMSDTQKTLIPLYNHLIKCPAVPDSTKENLRSLKEVHESERKGKSYGSQKALFTEVWRRLHGTVPKEGS